MRHKFTTKQRDFIKQHVKGRSNKELTEMFNAHFDLNLKITQIRAFKKNNKLKSGLDGRFKPGHTPFNKGKKGLTTGGVQTQFKKGHKPHNYMPVGSVRVNGDGYVDIKVRDPNVWKGKHILIWEKHNGPVPEGHAVIFGDGNRRNFNQSNLILVSRKQLAGLNRQSLIQKDADLTRVAVNIVDLQHQIAERKQP